MNIDFTKTTENAKVVNLSEIARQCNISRQTVVEVVKGVYPSMHSAKAQSVISLLRKHNVLAELPEIEKAA